MKQIIITATSAFGLLLLAQDAVADQTKGTEVSQTEIGQFQTGVATIGDVESKLGTPQRSGPLASGGTTADYILMQESANAASYIPVARLVAGAMNLHETRVEFQFDSAGHLAAVQTSTRDLVCPHRVCGPDQLSQPWIPSQTQGD